MEVHAIGIDLGKTLFHLVGLDSSGNVIVRKRCSRTHYSVNPLRNGTSLNIRGAARNCSYLPVGRRRSSSKKL
jgi:hypothetical protein